MRGGEREEYIMRLHVLPAIVSSQEGPLQEALYTHIILCSSSECTLGKHSKDHSIRNEDLHIL